MFVNNFVGMFTSQSLVTMNIFSHYVSIDTTEQTLILELTIESVNYVTLAAPISFSSVNAKCDDFLAYVFDGEVTQQRINKLIVASVFTVDILPAAYAIGWAFYKLGNCPSSRKLKKRDLDSFLELPKIKTFLKAISKDFKLIQQPMVTMPTFQGPGTIMSVNPVQPIYLSNTPYIATGLNLDAVIPFTSDAVQDGSEYSFTQSNDSYNNSGSIFRRPIIITSNYTLTQFDGNIFLINATNGNIIITIPVGCISKNRLMEFKRIDSTSNSVTIVSPGGIDNCKEYKLNLCRKHPKKLSYIGLYGDGIKLYIFK